MAIASRPAVTSGSRPVFMPARKCRMPTKISRQPADCALCDRVVIRSACTWSIFRISNSSAATVRISTPGCCVCGARGGCCGALTWRATTGRFGWFSRGGCCWLMLSKLLLIWFWWVTKPLLQYLAGLSCPGELWVDILLCCSTVLVVEQVLCV